MTPSKPTSSPRYSRIWLLKTDCSLYTVSWFKPPNPLREFAFGPPPNEAKGNNSTPRATCFTPAVPLRARWRFGGVRPGAPAGAQAKPRAHSGPVSRRVIFHGKNATPRPGRKCHGWLNLDRGQKRLLPRLQRPINVNGSFGVVGRLAQAPMASQFLVL